MSLYLWDVLCATCMAVTMHILVHPCVSTCDEVCASEAGRNLAFHSSWHCLEGCHQPGTGTPLIYLSYLVGGLGRERWHAWPNPFLFSANLSTGTWHALLTRLAVTFLAPPVCLMDKGNFEVKCCKPTIPAHPPISHKIYIFVTYVRADRGKSFTYSLKPENLSTSICAAKMEMHRYIGKEVHTCLVGESHVHTHRASACVHSMHVDRKLRARGRATH